MNKKSNRTVKIAYKKGRKKLEEEVVVEVEEGVEAEDVAEEEEEEVVDERLKINQDK